jgi:hypothetical protein
VAISPQRATRATPALPKTFRYAAHIVPAPEAFWYGDSQIADDTSSVIVLWSTTVIAITPVGGISQSGGYVRAGMPRSAA